MAMIIFSDFMASVLNGKSSGYGHMFFYYLIRIKKQDKIGAPTPAGIIERTGLRNEVVNLIIIFRI